MTLLKLLNRGMLFTVDAVDAVVDTQVLLLLYLLMSFATSASATDATAAADTDATSLQSRPLVCQQVQHTLYTV